MSNQVYQIVTDRIISLLESGTIPWHKPWSNYHKNMVSKKGYRGLNVFLLEAAAIDKGYKSNYWLSYKQATSLGGQVKKGEKSTLVIFWTWLSVTDKDKPEQEEGKRIPFLRYYNVFNVEQCTWPDGFTIPVDSKNNNDPIIECERIVNGMPNAPEVKHAGSRAYYSPSDDYVSLPDVPYFGSSEEYYSVLFHELTHSTGHHSRLNRFEAGSNLAGFGSQDYSKEELIAEMGASMLCGVTGIENKTIDNSAAYIKSWLNVLRDDVKFVINAASKAQKAADYIQGISWDDDSNQ